MRYESGKSVNEQFFPEDSYAVQNDKIECKKNYTCKNSRNKIFTQVTFRDSKNAD